MAASGVTQSHIDPHKSGAAFHLPVDNNWVENQIRPWALGRSSRLFAGSLRSGKRAAAIMSFIRRPGLMGVILTPT